MKKYIVILAFVTLPIFINSISGKCAVNQSYLDEIGLSAEQYQHMVTLTNTYRDKESLPYYIWYEYIDYGSSTDVRTLAWCQFEEVPIIMTGFKSGDSYGGVAFFPGYKKKFRPMHFGAAGSKLLNYNYDTIGAASTYDYQTPKVSPFTMCIPKYFYRDKYVGGSAMFEHGIEVKILFTNLELADTTGKVTFPVKYSLQNCSDGLKPGETAAEKPDTSEDDTGVLGWLSNLSSKIGAMFESILDMVHAIDVLPTKIMDGITDFFTPKLSASAFEDLKNMIYTKWPFMKQCEVIFDNILNSDKYETYALADGDMYGPDNQYHWNFDKYMWTWKLPQSFGGKTVTLIDIKEWGLYTVFSTLKQLLMCIIIIKFSIKMYNRIPSILQALQW